MSISLSILEYEPDLATHSDDLSRSESLPKIVRIVETGKIHRVHVDVMRPPLIPNTTKFSTQLMKQLYVKLSDKVLMGFHLMVNEPFPIVEEINGFVPEKDRAKTIIIIQRESFTSERETIEALGLLKKYGYEAGICLDLPTPTRALTKKIVEAADTLLIMSVPMGQGGQKYGDEATRRIADFSRRFPLKLIEVDGGIDPRTIITAAKAGAGEAVVGSFITRNNLVEAIQAFEQSLRSLEKT